MSDIVDLFEKKVCIAKIQRVEKFFSTLKLLAKTKRNYQIQIKNFIFWAGNQFTQYYLDSRLDA